ncbi:MAG: VOC family protein [Candidatus Eisenbacteria bacterium]|uniref:VOC family protein n=1 Tax=Eiseniibacteriota bacterium TaxID=2212470 RepID=A0A538S9E0_UNCEI|nr:MAG: VOC family protein [Candidatus Eisenbacteria bacterium]
MRSARSAASRSRHRWRRAPALRWPRTSPRSTTSARAVITGWRWRGICSSSSCAPPRRAARVARAGTRTIVRRRGPRRRAPARAPVRTHGLTHVALAVRDPQRSLRFYQAVLGVAFPDRSRPRSMTRCRSSRCIPFRGSSLTSPWTRATSRAML